MSLVDATALVSAFAAARQIPVLRYGDAPRPRCAWTAEAEELPGLWAEFIHPPRLDGDLARVALATSCMAYDGAFMQVHEFTLRRGAGEWIVDTRALTEIT